MPWLGSADICGFGVALRPRALSASKLPKLLGGLASRKLSMPKNESWNKPESCHKALRSLRSLESAGLFGAELAVGAGAKALVAEAGIASMGGRAAGRSMGSRREGASGAREGVASGKKTARSVCAGRSQVEIATGQGDWHHCAGFVTALRKNVCRAMLGGGGY